MACTTFAVGDWQVTVVVTNADATEEVTAENQFNEIAEGRQPVMAEVEATYVGEESGLAWTDLSFSYVTADGNTYATGSDDYCGVIPSSLDDAGETFPDGSVAGNVCIQVPSEQVPDGLWMVEAAMSFDDDDRTFVAAGV